MMFWNVFKYNSCSTFL